MINTELKFVNDLILNHSYRCYNLTLNWWFSVEKYKVRIIRRVSLKETFPLKDNKVPK